MGKIMSHRERIMETLKGTRTDRTPVSMWRHFFSCETTAEGLAEAMLAYQADFDWDFMKVNPRASYQGEDWGLRTKYQGDGGPVVVDHPIKQTEDWRKLRPLDPRKGVLGEHLRALELIAKGMKNNAPFVMTVFNPISVASRLASSEEAFLKYLHEDTADVLAALEAITATSIEFSRACLERGASGIFLAATAWATTSRLSEDEYRAWARPYDIRLLDSVHGEFNILHVCRDHNMLATLSDYPVQAFNWDCWGEGNPTLTQGKSLVRGKAVIGGVLHGTRLTAASSTGIARDLKAVQRSMGDSGWILGGGCTYKPETPVEVIRAVRKAVELGAGKDENLRGPLP